MTELLSCHPECWLFIPAVLWVVKNNSARDYPVPICR